DTSTIVTATVALRNRRRAGARRQSSRGIKVNGAVKTRGGDRSAEVRSCLAKTPPRTHITSSSGRPLHRASARVSPWDSLPQNRRASVTKVLHRHRNNSQADWSVCVYPPVRAQQSIH